MDQDGFLAITGRKKELLVTAGGKKIPTQKIENLLQSHSLVSHAVLVGEGRPFCSALITVDTQMLSLRAKQLKKELPSDPSKCDWLLDELSSHLAVINKELASFEQVKKIAIIEPDFSVDNGLLTPTLKVRRALVVEKFSEQIDSLYESGS
jgi:long-chain acyl-CoA synthetase